MITTPTLARMMHLKWEKFCIVLSEVYHPQGLHQAEEQLWYLFPHL